MDDKNFDLATKLLSKSYVASAAQNKNSLNKLMTDLLSQRKIPKEGWPSSILSYILNQLSMMDSNNFIDNVGVGEREARIYSDLVRERHYSLGHGLNFDHSKQQLHPTQLNSGCIARIGRSGDISAEQPKAAGSSLVSKLAHYLVLDALRLAGYFGNWKCLLLPMATGMSLTLTFLALKAQNPSARYVVIPRMDQKSGLKSVVCAGLEPVIVENVLETDEIRTDLKGIEKALQDKKGMVLCVLSTTSCFAPRAPDRVEELAILCKQYAVGHIVNNAYGIQSSKAVSAICESARKGTVDYVVSSMDKNFLVPVGGAFVISQKPEAIDHISKLYPGRASMDPLLDVFVTLLAMGVSGWVGLLKERKQNLIYFKEKLAQFAAKHNEAILNSPHNDISIGMSVRSFSKDPTYLGSMLFLRNVSGTRIVNPEKASTVSGISFQGYGSHLNNYPVPYITCACAIGIKRIEIDTFFDRLEKAWKELSAKHSKQTIPEVLKSESEPKSSKSESESKSPKSESESKSSKSESKSKSSKSESKSESKSQLKSESKSQLKSESKSQLKSSESKPKSNFDPNKN